MQANIVCIKWGTKYGSNYVNRLLRGIEEHLSMPARFVCLTDNATGIDSKVEIHPLPTTPFDEQAFDARKGGETWRKVGLFKPGLADLQGDTLFLDLDVVLTGPLDDFFSFQPGRFCVIHDWLEKRRAWMPGRDGKVGNTSVFRFNPASHSRVYDHFCDHQTEVLEAFRIEQQYVSRTLMDDLAFWPEEWVCSFKRSCRPLFPLNLIREPYQPSEMRVLAFHGYPLPDQAIAGYQGGMFKSTLPATWLKNHWNDAA
ncbi:hypothetical protein Pla52o_32330 [Novipirellula galeiformis]|uniref:Glycosyltransferase n=1 Tax=Novipirellula galeiformis TaxID=2528004 RepID=A0A5C6CD72_9BACT|nr:hypothetical protein [Novipirellula galeiformis]TWU22178.1 hypothetical protein Pla52o_32330 [Novipirellula galeiformis]